MSAPYLPTPPPWFYLNGEVCADVDGQICIARADREPENPIRPVERDANMRAIAELPSLIACLEALIASARPVPHKQGEGSQFYAEVPKAALETAKRALARALDKGGQS